MSLYTCVLGAKPESEPGEVREDGTDSEARLTTQ